MNISSSAIKKYSSYIGLVLAVVSVVFLVRLFIDTAHVFEGVALTLENVFIFIGLLFFYLFGYLVFSYSWRLQLSEKYPEFSLVNSFSIIGCSQIGKYLPGNVAQFFARLAMLPPYMQRSDVVYTMFVENVVMLVTSSVVGVFYVFYFDFMSVVSFGDRWLALFVVIAVTMLSFVFLKLLRRRFKFLDFNLIVILKVLTISFMSSFMGGVTIYILVYVFGHVADVTYLQCVTGFALSFMVGFIVPGAPGGVGVREFFFVMLFGGFVSDAVALEIILTFRVLSILGDGVLFLLAYRIKGRGASL